MKKLTILCALAGFVITSTFTGCISVKRETTEPTTSTVTTRTTQSSPTATTRTVKRTTTQF